MVQHIEMEVISKCVSRNHPNEDIYRNIMRYMAFYSKEYLIKGLSHVLLGLFKHIEFSLDHAKPQELLLL